MLMNDKNDICVTKCVTNGEKGEQTAILFSSNPERGRQLQKLMDSIGAKFDITSDPETAKKMIEAVGHELLISDVSGFDPNGINMLNWFNLNRHKRQVNSLGIITAATPLVPKVTYKISYDHTFIQGDITFDNLTTAMLTLYSHNSPIEWLKRSTNAYHIGHEKLKSIKDGPHVVLLTGELGVGKDSFAQIAHEKGGRREHKFVHVDCSLERDMSYIKGTKAVNRKEMERNIQALMAEADHGTLYFHEAGQLPMDVQNILADVISKNVYTVPGTGGKKKFSGLTIISVDSTMKQNIVKGKFSASLFDVSSPITVTIPSLTECKQDIVPLADAFLKGFCMKEGLPIMEISVNAQKTLRKHIWTGNVRELYSVITRAAAQCDQRSIKVTDLSLQSSHEEEEKPTNHKAVVKKALRDGRGNKAKAGRILGTTRQTIYRWMKKYDIPDGYGKPDAEKKKK